jgi:hypothetical protein
MTTPATLTGCVVVAASHAETGASSLSVGYCNALFAAISLSALAGNAYI